MDELRERYEDEDDNMSDVDDDDLDGIEEYLDEMSGDELDSEGNSFDSSEEECSCDSWEECDICCI